MTASSPITVATCALPVTESVRESVALHMAYINEAADQDASLVVFPECSLQGYPWPLTEACIRQVESTSESISDGPNVRHLVELARGRGICVAFGMTERTKTPGVLYNTSVLTGPDGVIGTYRKVHLGVLEHQIWRQGDDWPVFTTPVGDIGMMICYDKCWPEASRELMLRGAEILLFQTAWMLESGERMTETDEYLWYRWFDRVRAVENSRWFISSNFAGDIGAQHYFGEASIIDPSGRTVACTETGRAGLAVATVDVRAGISEAHGLWNRSGGLVHGPASRLIRDRRPDTYRALRGELEPATNG